MGTERTILNHLKTARRADTSKPRSNIIICHRLSAVTDADEIVVLHHGALQERGRHTQLLEHDGWYSQMFRYQQIEQQING